MVNHASWLFEYYLSGAADREHMDILIANAENAAAMGPVERNPQAGSSTRRTKGETKHRTPKCVERLLPEGFRASLDLNEKRWKVERLQEPKTSYSQKFKISGSRTAGLEVMLAWAWRSSGKPRPSACTIDSIPAAEWEGNFGVCCVRLNKKMFTQLSEFTFYSWVEQCSETLFCVNQTNVDVCNRSSG